jgi:hypothetical protein
MIETQELIDILVQDEYLKLILLNNPEIPKSIKHKIDSNYIPNNSNLYKFKPARRIKLLKVIPEHEINALVTKYHYVYPHNRKATNIIYKLVNEYVLPDKAQKELIKNDLILELLAQNPSINIETQKKLVNCNYNKVKIELSKNPNLTQGIAYKMFCNSDKEIRDTLLENANLSKIFKNYLCHTYDKIRSMIAINPYLPIEFQEKALNDESILVQLRLASNPNLDYNIAIKLAKLNIFSIKNALAYNTNLWSRIYEI